MSGLTNIALEYFHANPKAKTISIDSWEPMERLKWQLCETLPLDFFDKESHYSDFLGYTPVGMEVSLNGKQLFRNQPIGQVIASPQGTYIKLGNLEFKYVIATEWKIIHPVEARGLKIRIRNVGIGPRTYLEIQTESRTFSRLYWLSGEINVINGLDESLSLTRDSFIWSSEYQSLKEFFYPVLYRAHAEVEAVAEVEKEVNLVFHEASTPSVLANEMIDRSAKRLQSAGYAVAHISKEESASSALPIRIDKRNKTATIIDDYEPTRPAGQNDIVRIARFGMRNEEPVRLADDGVIELNSEYPLFKGVGKGRIMKQLHVILFQAKRDCLDVNQMYDYIIKKLKEEFG
jgi:hypothetical protein